MENNLKQILRLLSIVIIFFLIGAVNSFAQDGEVTGSSETVDGFFNDSSIITDGNIVSEEDPEAEQDNEKKSRTARQRERKEINPSDVWQAVSGISLAVIALFVLGFAALLLLKKGGLQIIFGGAKSDAEKAGQNDNYMTSERSSMSEVSLSEFNRLKDSVNDIKTQFRQLNDKIDSQTREVSRFESNLSSFKNDIADNKQKINSMDVSVSSLKNDIVNEREKYQKKEEVENDPIGVFNKWAQNASQPLPKYFVFVSIPKVEFRTRQEFNDTNADTDWIRNTIGERKYLFPNPKKIDSLSGPVDKLYKVVGTRRGQGSNTVKIIEACLVKEGNFIEYQGELNLI